MHCHCRMKHQSNFWLLAQALNEVFHFYIRCHTRKIYKWDALYYLQIWPVYRCTCHGCFRIPYIAERLLSQKFCLITIRVKCSSQNNWLNNQQTVAHATGVFVALQYAWWRNLNIESLAVDTVHSARWSPASAQSVLETSW